MNIHHKLFHDCSLPSGGGITGGKAALQKLLSIVIRHWLTLVVVYITDALVKILITLFNFLGKSQYIKQQTNKTR